MWKSHVSFGVEVSSCGSNPRLHTMQNTAGDVEVALAASAIHWVQKGGEFGKKCQMVHLHGNQTPPAAVKWISKTTSIVTRRGNPPSPKSHRTEPMTTVLPAHCGQQLTCTFPPSCGSSEPIFGSSFWVLWQLKELNRKNGLTTDEMWTWSTCWNKYSSQRLASELNAAMIFHKLEWTDALWTPRKISPLNSHLPAFGSVSFLEDQTSWLLPTN